MSWHGRLVAKTIIQKNPARRSTTVPSLAPSVRFFQAYCINTAAVVRYVSLRRHSMAPGTYKQYDYKTQSPRTLSKHGCAVSGPKKASFRGGPARRLEHLARVPGIASQRAHAPLELKGLAHCAFHIAIHLWDLHPRASGRYHRELQGLKLVAVEIQQRVGLPGVAGIQY